MTTPGTQGRRLGELEILHALKAGGMGEVLLARRRGPGGFEQLCAVKTIRPELASAPLVRTMFLDEARLLARLTHPAIAQILDFGEDDGTVYMAIEYVAGEHFRRFAERRPPAAIVCQAVAAACRGLHAAHELRDVGDGHLLGVVHRDISPDNLMLGFDGRVKVLDFGIALVKGRQAPATEFGVLKGKPPYMSPEQLRNQELDRRADVFSIAVVLHELLTGQHLFTGDSIYAVVHAVEHQVIEPPSRVAGPLPPELDDVVMAGLERDRDRRLRSAAAMAEVLERIAAGSGGESLAGWAERELVRDRDEHRRWMAKVVTGRVLAPAGRLTGIVTALAEAGPTDPTGATAAGLDTGAGAAPDVDRHDVDASVRATQLADISELGPSTAVPEGPIAGPQLGLVAPEPTLAPVADTRVEAVAGGSATSPGTGTMARALARPARRRWLVALVALAGVLGLALVLLLAGRGERGQVAAADVDAALPVPAIDDGAPATDAAVVIDVPGDAAVVIDVPADAAVANDAAVVAPFEPRRRRDAGLVRPREAIDAAVWAASAIDAGAAAAVGTAFLSASAYPSVLVVVDGAELCVTPACNKRRIPAGTHTIVLLDVVTRAEVHRRTVTLAAGQLETVRYTRDTP
jgi:hypothetical protein